MAEQNILNGDQQVLEQILGDINEHAEKKERLERMSVSIRDITKEIDSTTKAMEDEISSRISESTDSICAGYDKAVFSVTYFLPWAILVGVVWIVALITFSWISFRKCELK